eukprot:snap_masked-scaffold_19-processed-gene-6.40-mRNA-1 protein AED:1.00 eAED:1.00 QI:0/0/0/0/1/1/2/0/99
MSQGEVSLTLPRNVVPPPGLPSSPPPPPGLARTPPQPVDVGHGFLRTCVCLTLCIVFLANVAVGVLVFLDEELGLEDSNEKIMRYTSKEDLLCPSLDSD